MLGEVADEVGPHRDDQTDGGPRVGRQLAHGVEELLPLTVVGAGSPGLLELVDGDDHSSFSRVRCRDEVGEEVGDLVSIWASERYASELPHRMVPGTESDDPPPRAPRESIRSERREQPGPQHRGLPRAGVADQGQDP